MDLQGGLCDPQGQAQIVQGGLHELQVGLVVLQGRLCDPWQQHFQVLQFLKVHITSSASRYVCGRCVKMLRTQRPIGTGSLFRK